MDRQQTIARISGCYIPLPTLFRDGDFELNLDGMRRHVRFLLDAGVREGNGVFLVGGGAGEFSTLSTDERLRLLDTVLAEAGGRVGVVLGVQSNDQREAVRLARGAKAAGAVAIQAAPPFYHPPTDDDVFEWIAALAAADVGIVFYTTYWTGYRTSLEMLGRLADVPQIVAIKWASPSYHEFEQGLRHFASRLAFIDNQLHFVFSHMLGARGVNLHPSNYWPTWGVKFWELLEAGRYREAQDEMTRVVSPYYDLCGEVARFTGGEGHIDKLCLELVGLDSSRCRPPTRDIRPQFRERIRKMLVECGTIEEKG